MEADFFFVGQRNPLLSQVDRRPRDRPAGIGPGPARKSQPRRRRMGPGAGRAGSESVQQAGCSQPPAGPGTASQAGPGPARGRCSVASEASSSSPATTARPLAAFSLKLGPNRQLCFDHESLFRKTKGFLLLFITARGYFIPIQPIPMNHTPYLE